MTTMLVSFNLSFPANFSLATLDYDAGALNWVDLTAVGEDVKGVNGMVLHGGHYWCLAETDTGDKLLALDPTLKLVGKWDLQKSRSTHTIIPVERGFLVANTGYNGVSFLRPSPDGLEEEVTWRFSENDKDEVHVNSVAELNGKVYISMFGHRAEGIVQGGWSTATNGRVVNVTDDTIVQDGMLSPHTLVVHEGALYWLESRRGKVWRYTEGGPAEVILELPGFLRGLAFAGPHLYVAASASRRRSRSTGQLFEKAADTQTLQSWIYQVDRETMTLTRSFPMTLYAEEIFDLLVVEDVASLPAAGPVDPALMRLWAIRDVYLTWEQEATFRRNELRDLAKESQRRRHRASEQQRNVEEQAKALRIREKAIRQRLGEFRKLQEQSMTAVDRLLSDLRSEQLDTSSNGAGEEVAADASAIMQAEQRYKKDKRLAVDAGFDTNDVAFGQVAPAGRKRGNKRGQRVTDDDGKLADERILEETAP